MKIAVVGSGVAGLTAAHLLSRSHDVVLFEQDDRAGGHAHTVRVDLADETHWVDTGFLVYNEPNYPGLIALFADLGVATAPSDMSFGVSDEVTGIEWRGTDANTVFAQRRNAVRPAFLRMLVDIARFNRRARGLLETSTDMTVTLADLLADGRWSRQLLEWYLVPMGSSIWSADPSTFLEMPALTFARFFANHGLLEFGNQPAWRTVAGGSRHYVDAIVGRLGDRVRLDAPVRSLARHEDGVDVVSPAGTERFDQVVVAAHSDQALSLLADPTPVEHEILSAIRYQENRTTLHTDRTLLPRNRRAWASWNYHRLPDQPRTATLTYRLASLQGVQAAEELLVTLNRDDVIDPARVLRTFDYAHPVYDVGTVAAQGRWAEISGTRRTWYCGAYWGYGFHEDGVESARRVCRALAGIDL